jgi:hypothetical protein
MDREPWDTPEYWEEIRAMARAMGKPTPEQRAIIVTELLRCAKRADAQTRRGESLPAPERQ